MKAIIEKFRTKYTPLQQLLWLGFLVRLVSVFFSKGFAWQDDHFLILESSQSWVDGYFNYWLPTEEVPDREPQGHALFYIGIHYYILLFFKFIGLADPQWKMFVIRLLHALWSLLLISYGYKIANRYGGGKAAWYTGLFLALYWFMPFMSVRNLVELVCVPPLLIAIYLVDKPGNRIVDFAVAGFWLGIACSIRFQALFIVMGTGLALLIMRIDFRRILALALSFLFVVFLTQGVVDMVIWKRPFTEFMAYVDYNLHNASSYGSPNWHMYLDLLLGLLIPPLSIVLFAGYFFTWKKLPLLFWPVIIYLAFHTYFPNRQERFVMTILPMFIISGTVGMFVLYERHQQRVSSAWLKGCTIFVVVLNLLLLPVLSVSYSKRHRVEAMYYMYKKGDSNGFIVEDSNKENDIMLPPLFYYGNWFSVCGITKNYTALMAREYYNELPRHTRPHYMLFWQAENLDARVDLARQSFPGLKLEAVIEPSLIDKTMHRLNPENIDNETAYIFEIGEGK